MEEAYGASRVTGSGFGRFGGAHLIPHDAPGQREPLGGRRQAGQDTGESSVRRLSFKTNAAIENPPD